MYEFKYNEITYLCDTKGVFLRRNRKPKLNPMISIKKKPVYEKYVSLDRVHSTNHLDNDCLFHAEDNWRTNVFFQKMALGAFKCEE